MAFCLAFSEYSCQKGALWKPLGTARNAWIHDIRIQNTWIFWLNTRVVRGDINFGILRDPLNLLFLIDLYGPYLIEFLIENGSFLLTKAHVLGANWTSQPPTSEAFLANFSLGKGT